MVPLWTVLIPACLVLACVVLAFEARPRTLLLFRMAGLGILVALALLLLGILH